jgi:hypothetical protein
MEKVFNIIYFYLEAKLGKEIKLKENTNSNYKSKGFNPKRPNWNENYRGKNNNRNQPESTQEVVEEIIEANVDDDNDQNNYLDNQGYNNQYERYDGNYQTGRYNSYNNQYNYTSYGYNRGRGSRGRGRGYSTRGGRGRNQRFNNTYNSVDALFAHDFNIKKTNEETPAIENEENKVIKEESQVEENKNIESQAELTPSVVNLETQNIQEQTNTQTNSQINTQTNTLNQPTYSQNIHKQSDNDSNIFSTKDIPSNIRSNIKDLIDDTDISPTSNENKYNNQSVEKENEQKQKKNFEQFAVQSSSMSIGNSNKVTIPPQVIKQANTTSITNNSTNTPNSYQSQSQNFNIPLQNNKKNTNTSNLQQGNNKNMKINETIQQGTQPGPEYTQPYTPWGVSPMGFYPFQNMQSMNYDSNSMGANQVYPMMPMYYFPYMQQPDVEDSMGKKKVGFPQNYPGQPNVNLNFYYIGNESR